MLRCSRALRSACSPSAARRRSLACQPRCQAPAATETKAANARKLRSLAELNWDHTFVKELPCDPLTDNNTRKVVGYFSSRVDPTPTGKDPQTVITSDEASDHATDVALSRLAWSHFASHVVSRELARFVRSRASHSSYMQREPTVQVASGVARCAICLTWTRRSRCRRRSGPASSPATSSSREGAPCAPRALPAAYPTTGD